MSARLKSERRAFNRAVIGAPTAAFMIGGVRMLYRPVIDGAPVTLFVEERK